MAEMQFKIKAMNRDNALSSFNAEFAYEIYNMRVMATDSQTSFALTNEKGTQEITEFISAIDYKNNNCSYSPVLQRIILQGHVIGAAILNDNIYVFTHTLVGRGMQLPHNEDRLYEIKKVIEFEYQGEDKIEHVFYTAENLFDNDFSQYVDLNLDFEHPLDIIPYYESEDIQKLYWIDGKNQARMFNVISRNLTFDFLPEISFNNDIYIEKLSTGGNFPAGVIQYCFTFAVENGQESNIFYTSPLYYITRSESSGLPVGEYSNCSFKITFNNVEFRNFDTVRVYSLLRTTKNGEVDCRLVGKYTKDQVLSTITYTSGYSEYTDGKWSTFNLYPAIPEVQNTNNINNNISTLLLLHYIYSCHKNLDSGVQNNITFLQWLENDLQILGDDSTTEIIFHNIPYLSYTTTLNDNLQVNVKYINNITVSTKADTFAVSVTPETINLQGQTTIVTIIPNILKAQFYQLEQTPTVQLQVSDGEYNSIIAKYKQVYFDLYKTFSKLYSNLNQESLIPIQTMLISNNQILRSTLFSAAEYLQNAELYKASFSQFNLDTEQVKLEISQLQENLSLPMVKVQGKFTALNEELSEVIQNFSVVDGHQQLQETVNISHLLITCQRNVTIPKTIASKDGTLFLGNLEQPLLQLPEQVRNYFQEHQTFDSNGYPILDEACYIWKEKSVFDTLKYKELNDLNVSKESLSIFKSNEYYRFGLQGITKFGEKTQVLNLGFIKIKNINKRNNFVISYYPEVIIPAQFCQDLQLAGIKQLRLVFESDNNANKCIVCQGIVSPTVFRYDLRTGDAPFAMSSWFIRANDDPLLTTSHYDPLLQYKSHIFGTEIQSSPWVEQDSDKEFYAITNMTRNVEDSDNIGLWVEINTCNFGSVQVQDQDCIYIAGGIGVLKDGVTQEDLQQGMKEKRDYYFGSQDYLYFLKDYFKPNTFFIFDGSREGYSVCAMDKIPQSQQDKQRFDEYGYYYLTTDRRGVEYADQKIYYDVNVANGIYAQRHKKGYKHNAKGKIPTHAAELIARMRDKFNYSDVFNLGTDDIKNLLPNKYWENGSKSHTLSFVQKRVIREQAFLGKAKKHSIFYVDKSILTFHSPDVKNITTISETQNQYSLNYINTCILETASSCQNITLETSKRNRFCVGPIEGYSPDSSNTGVYTYWGYQDDYASKSIVNGYSQPRHFLIYPWHKSNNLGAQSNIVVQATNKIDPSDVVSTGTYFGKAKTKTLGNFRTFTPYSFDITVQQPIFSAALFDGSQVPAIKLQSPIKRVNNTINQDYSFITYQGNVDIIQAPSTIKTFTSGEPPSQSITSVLEYEIYGVESSKFDDFFTNQTTWQSPTLAQGEIEHIELYPNNTETGDSVYTNGTYKCSEPIWIKYSSSAHIVLSLGKDSNGNIITLPENGVQQSTVTNFQNQIFSSQENGDLIFSTEYISNLTRDNSAYLFVVDLVTPNLYESAKEDFIQWIPAGEFISITDIDDINDINDLESDTTIEVIKVSATIGDNFFGIWQNLKTYATTPQDYNQIVDVTSIPLESKINLLARTDRNKQTCNINITPNNFDIYNDVYDQQDNVFIYFSESQTAQQYNNQVILSLTKNNGEEIDNWTTITQASVVDLDGVNGSLTKLELWNDKLLAFQEKAVNYIPFNSRVAVETNDGVPIEIANSGKVDMPVIMTNKIGCQNKWSICGTSHYLYFIDNYNQGIYRIGGEQGFQNLSDSKGFHSWMQNESSLDLWNPKQFTNFKVCWDIINNEVLFIKDTVCLAFNEQLDEFTAFYSYEHIPYIMMLNGDVFSFNSTYVTGNTQEILAENKTHMYQWWHGKYNEFFGSLKNYYIDIIANEHPMTTKVFNTVDYTADMFNGNTHVAAGSFNYIKAIDEYQTGEYIISNNSTSITEPYPLKKKFRLWSVDIPRDGDTADSIGDKVENNIHSRADRMSNPWVKITLKRDNTKNIGQLVDSKDTSKFVLHNLIVNYTEQ